LNYYLPSGLEQTVKTIVIIPATNDPNFNENKYFIDVLLQSGCSTASCLTQNQVLRANGGMISVAKEDWENYGI
jgi:hypothetical protein